MKLRAVAWLSAITLALLQTSYGQGFVNLDFEDATIATTAPGQWGPGIESDRAAIFPGWSIQGYWGYNTLTIGTPAVILMGPEFPNAPGYEPLQGSYSALLQFGPGFGFPGAALSQTGLVPAISHSISLLTDPNLNPNQSDAIVSLNGIVIPLIDVGSGRMAGDVSAFAGQVVTLRIATVQYGDWFYFDDVQFSSAVVVPEPSTFCLAGVGIVGLLLHRTSRSK